MTTSLIYLDHAATTPLDPAVREAMLPFLDDAFGNPSSAHQVGQRVRRALDTARDQLASALGSAASEVIFTSGGTEANNSALWGVLLAARDKGRDHLITTTAEHHSVLDTATFARELGFSVTLLPVDELARLPLESLEAALTDRTALVSVLHANNEVGTIQEIAALAELAHAHGALFHTDAVQTLGQLPLSVTALGVDLASVSSHKIYGPKGVGALYLRRGVPFVARQRGGMQEQERRAGTENVPGIVGFGAAAALLPTWRDATAARLIPLRERFVARFPNALLNGDPERRLPGNLSLSFPGADGETLLLALDLAGICVSAGSACASGSIDPSHVLKAMGLPFARTQATLRITLGRSTTEADIDRAADVLEGLLAKG